MMKTSNETLRLLFFLVLPAALVYVNACVSADGLMSDSEDGRTNHTAATPTAKTPSAITTIRGNPWQSVAIAHACIGSLWLDLCSAANLWQSPPIYQESIRDV